MHIQQLGGIYNITTFLALFTSAVVTVIVIKIVAYKRRIFIVVVGANNDTVVPEGGYGINYSARISSSHDNSLAPQICALLNKSGRLFAFVPSPFQIEKQVST